jgi:hypothetical protein
MRRPFLRPTFADTSNGMRSILLLFVLRLTTPAFGQQLLIPPTSPPGRVIQQVGFTAIELYYERPAARGRSEKEIFGSLVPFGKVWRTGAGNCTTLKFSTDVIINSKKVPKGKYALFTIPGTKEWTVILNTDTLAYGAYNYDEKKDVMRMKVNPRRTHRYYEALTIDIDFIPNDARIYISWVNTQIAFDVHTGLDQKILSFIHDNLIARHSDNPDLYEAAIVYYLWHRQDRKQVMNFINRGISLKNDRLWYYWKVEELMKDQRYDEAHAAAMEGIDAINASSESQARKTELISDFQKYIVDIAEKSGKR